VQRITRNKLLIWVIALGLINFAVYTLAYAYLQGDARNGFIEDGQYYLRGHFLRSRTGRATEPVGRSVWLYSFVHSITIWPTIGAVLASMLVLARPHIIATMKSDTRLSGRTIVNGCLLLVILVTLASTVLFVMDLFDALSAIAHGRDFGV